MLREVQVEKFRYKSLLGEIEAPAKIMLDDESFHRFKKEGHPVDELDYGLTDESIVDLERRAAFAFFQENFSEILAGDRLLAGEVIKGIVEIFGVTRSDTAKLLGISKGQLSHLINNDRKISHTVSLLLMERLGMELARPGSSKALLGLGEVGAVERHLAKEIAVVRYSVKKKRAA